MTTTTLRPKPSVVLLCHEEELIDVEGLAAWLSTSMRLVALVIIRPSWARAWRAARREIRRSGIAGFIDVLAFRAYYRIALAGRDAAWQRDEVARLQARYPASTRQAVRVHVSDPNDEAVRRCLRCIRPDLVIARCKVLLRPDIFEIARAGTYALHPGICPEYRNAHGCFWALARRDIGRVGMTLLRIDRGVDTGPAFLRASCAYDELHESHIVIQHRVVTENLDAIAGVLTRLAQGRAEPLESAARESAVWGQPTLSAYRAWKAGAKRDRNHAAHLTAVP